MKTVLYALYVLLVLIVLFPKERIYTLIKERLATENIYLSGETTVNGIFSYEADETTLIGDSVALATVDRIRLRPLILLNDIDIDGLRAANDFAPMFPGEIKHIRLRHTFWNPLAVFVVAEGDFGNARGTLDLTEGKLVLKFDTDSRMRRYLLLVSKLRSQKGELVYEHTF